MIAVLARNEEPPVVREFFELFKTPWGFYQQGDQSEVLICSDDCVPDTGAKLVLIYGGKSNTYDQANGIQIHSHCSQTMLSYDGRRLPVCGNSLTFRNSSCKRLIDENSREPAMLKINSKNQTIIRIGYDLFSEIHSLLTNGQSPARAQIPALETHIALLRDLITSHSIPLVEIPPVPENCRFIACLTHDVDHVGIRNHKFDHTMFGFLYRATIGSALDFLKGKKSLKQVGINWQTAASLPFVYLGFAKDFWHTFERYVEIEKGLNSTFFVIPKKGDSGVDRKGNRPNKRAASYDVVELAETLKILQATGNEIGVHGIDAWRDSAKGGEERERISSLIGATELGVRMHWLFFDKQSPALLENAGFSYDSTIGYNETVGYRAGTTQVFKPLTTKKMLELPMHVMDTALFYPSYLDLTSTEADDVVRPLIENAIHFGGVLTINWHDRSIAPERLWGDFYIRLLEKLKTEKAWFATAAQTVSWFRKRRSATFQQVTSTDGSVKIKVNAGSNDNLPGLRMRIFKPAKNPTSNQPNREFVDMPLENCIEMDIAA